MSFYALETEGENDDMQWLTYWVVFGLFNITDQFAGFILHFIPFYYVLKVAVLIWLFHPSSKGATYVYREYIQPFSGDINKLEESIKSVTSKSFVDIKDTITGGKK